MFATAACSRAHFLRPAPSLSSSLCSPLGRNLHTRSRSLAASPPKTETESSLENLNVEHASTIANAESAGESAPHEHGHAGAKHTSLAEDLEDVGRRSGNGVLQGKLLPTASRLFKLVLPLPEKPFSSDSPSSGRRSGTPASSYPPTIFLLHPSQPLSHISRLITASFPTSDPRISFQSSFAPARDKMRDVGLVQGGGRDDPLVNKHAIPAGDEGEGGEGDANGGMQWSDSTDIGDFIKEAARDTEFLIVIQPGPGSDVYRQQQSESDSRNKESKEGSGKKGQAGSNEQITQNRFPSSSSPSSSSSSRSPSPRISIRVRVPSFGDRTHFLRARLATLTREISEMEELKVTCDKEAHRGARRVALSGFGALVVYWGAVARLTFWDLGWDVMEPVTYLSGLSTVICGYLWFLYQGREVSYSSVLSTSILSRRHALYETRGFDVARWSDLNDERRNLRKEIARIAMDYDVGWKEGDHVRESEDEVKKGEDESGTGTEGEKSEGDEKKDEVEEDFEREQKDDKRRKAIMSD